MLSTAGVGGVPIDLELIALGDKLMSVRTTIGQSDKPLRLAQ